MSQIPGTPDDIAGDMDVFDMDVEGEVRKSGSPPQIYQSAVGPFSFKTWISEIHDLDLRDIEYFGQVASGENCHCELITINEPPDIQVNAVVIWEGPVDVPYDEFSEAFIDHYHNG